MKKKEIDKTFGSIMVIVPHQDDELLLCAGILKKAAVTGLDVSVVMVTNGDYGDMDGSIGRQRLKETLAGLKLLGIEETQVEFLGYADTGMPREDSFLYHLYEDKDGKIIRSHCSDQTYSLEEHQELHRMTYGAHASYCRENLVSDIREVIELKKPENIFTTSEFDSHGDHEGLYLFIREILEEQKRDGKDIPTLYSGVVHSLAGDEIWPLREDEVNAYTCPPDFDNTSGFRWEDRISFPVPEEMLCEDRKQNLKYQAIAQHVTALKPDAVDYLYSFVKSEELFWKIEL